MPSRTSRTKGVLLLALALAALAMVVDLLRQDSVLLATWRRLNPSGTRLERTIDRAQRIRPGAQRINRSEGVEGVMPEVARAAPA